jgi:hypothetical protein
MCSVCVECWDWIVLRGNLCAVGKLHKHMLECGGRVLKCRQLSMQQALSYRMLHSSVVRVEGCHCCPPATRLLGPAGMRLMKLAVL